MPSAQEHLDEHQQQYLDELLDFLRIPSVSALPQHAEDVRRAGQWVADRLTRAGVENVRILETGGHPVVYGDFLHAPGKPTVMIYGHFDVQPVDPVALWTTPRALSPRARAANDSLISSNRYRLETIWSSFSLPLM